ncbi:hypothetical protein JB92DRAFT_3119489 [Gautieria morchelliformis]|nr:hypothetical protein JB92DRAFT_3119489 [Gautieria morchelliformis]
MKPINVHYRSWGGDLRKNVSKSFRNQPGGKTEADEPVDIDRYYTLVPPVHADSFRAHLTSMLVYALTGSPYKAAGVSRRLHIMDVWTSESFVMTVSVLTPVVASCTIDLENGAGVTAEALSESCESMMNEYSDTSFKASFKELKANRLRVIGKLAPDALDGLLPARAANSFRRNARKGEQR